MEVGLNKGQFDALVAAWRLFHMQFCFRMSLVRTWF